MKTIPLIVSSFLTGRSYCSLLLLIYLTLCTTNCCPFSLKGSLLSPVNRKSFQISNRHTTLQSGLNNMPASTKFTLKQFLNVPGLKALGLIFTDPVKVVPTIHVPTLQSLDLDRLKAQGIECIVFDKDNTLTYCYAEEIHPSVVPVVEKARRLFPNGIAILSNSAGSCDDVDFNMAKFTEEKLSIPVIRHEEKKPGCLDEVIVHFEEKLQKKIQPQQICVIGDRVMTDVVFGNIYNMTSVLVDPLTYRRDHPAAVVIRFFEVHILLPIIRFVLSIGPLTKKKDGEDKMK